MQNSSAVCRTGLHCIGSHLVLGMDWGLRRLDGNQPTAGGRAGAWCGRAFGQRRCCGSGQRRCGCRERRQWRWRRHRRWCHGERWDCANRRLHRDWRCNAARWDHRSWRFQAAERREHRDWRRHANRRDHRSWWCQAAERRDHRRRRRHGSWRRRRYRRGHVHRLSLSSSGRWVRGRWMFSGCWDQRRFFRKLQPGDDPGGV